MTGGVVGCRLVIGMEGGRFVRLRRSALVRRCVVCAHPERDEIERALGEGNEISRVARQYGLGASSLARHAVLHVDPQVIAQRAGIEAVEEAIAREREQSRSFLSAIDINVEMAVIYKRLRALLDAIDDYLRDPLDPSRYTVDPRAVEIQVVYDELVDAGNGRVMREVRSATLQDILDRISAVTDGTLVPMALNWKVSDPRRLMVEVGEQAARHLDMLRALMESDPRFQKEVRIEESKEWQNLKLKIGAILRDYPEAAAAVARALGPGGLESGERDSLPA